MAGGESCSRLQVHSAGAGGDETLARFAGAVGGLALKNLN
jgi:hypothetical protein